MRRSSLSYKALWIAMLAVPALRAQRSGPPAGVPIPSVTPSIADRAAPTAQVNADATVFRIRVLDGRNGQPLLNAHVQLWYDDAGSNGFLLDTPSNGTVQMPEPIGMPVRVLLAAVDRIDCRKLPSNEPAPGYNLQQIAEKGMVLQNTCGPVSAKAKPGELVLFARPLRWYENINRP